MPTRLTAILILFVGAFISLVISGFIQTPDRTPKLWAQLDSQQNSAEIQYDLCDFTKNLFLGRVGDEVKCLQQYLNKAGFVLALSGPGSPGNETIYFGPKTKAALARWQAANKVSPPSGYFGPISKAQYSKIKYGELVNKSVLLFGHTGPGPGPSPTPDLTPSLSPAPTSIPVPGRIVIGAFGGKINLITDCTCSRPKGLLIQVGPPIETDVMFIPDKSQLVAGALQEGRWTLGIAKTNFAVCLVPGIIGCSPEGAGRVITIIGTD